MIVRDRVVPEAGAGVRNGDTVAIHYELRLANLSLLEARHAVEAVDRKAKQWGGKCDGEQDQKGADALRRDTVLADSRGHVRAGIATAGALLLTYLSWCLRGDRWGLAALLVGAFSGALLLPILL